MKLKRWYPYVCNCEFGAHIEYDSDAEGEWLRFEDVAATIHALADRCEQDPTFPKRELVAELRELVDE